MVESDIQILCGGTHSDGSCKPIVVCLEDVVARHPEVADLVFFGVVYHAYLDDDTDRWAVEYEGDVLWLDEFQRRMAALVAG